MSGPLSEQELVVHLFAPLDGPHAADALRQVRDLWDNCRSQLGMTGAILDAELDGRLPDDPAAEPEGALAGIQDQAVNFQAVARREHDILNVSLVMATPVAPAPRRRAGTPAGWYEFTRWWRMLTANGTGALLGTALVFLAKDRRVSADDVRTVLPARDDDADIWWTRRLTVRDFAVWEASIGGGRASRRLVVVGRPGEDARLSRFTWSAGTTALPPLGRYLLHAAKVRYHARVRGDGQELARMRHEAAARLDRVTGLLRDPATAEQAHASSAALAADEAALTGTLDALRQMRRSVEIARSNMAGALDPALPSDEALATWLDKQLGDDAEFLESTRERAARVREIAGFARPAATTSALPEAPPAEPAPVRDLRVEQRLAYGVDVVGYSGRSAPQQYEVQARVAGMADRVLGLVGLRSQDTDRQDAGDGMMVVLPAAVEPHRVLPGLLHGWRAELAEDNAAHADDRIRLRLSVSSGPFTTAAIGFSGGTIIEVGRLLDSDALRAAVREHADADLMAIVSDRLYQDVVGEGWPGLESKEFVSRDVAVKTYRRPAWIWAGAEAGPAASAPPPAPAAPAQRTVFLIHADDPAREAVAGLLRALDLRPLDWSEIVARTGHPTPFLRDVLDQAFVDNQAAVVLITPAGAATVMFQAGMAMARQRERTVIVQIGDVRPAEELQGHDIVRITADPRTQARAVMAIAQRLRNAGCAVNLDGADWLDRDWFGGLDAL